MDERVEIMIICLAVKGEELAKQLTLKFPEVANDLADIGSNSVTLHFGGNMRLCPYLKLNYYAKYNVGGKTVIRINPKNNNGDARVSQRDQEIASTLFN